ncbi:alcohol oxidase [Heliocybe sulcata]|uniref:Alcohol oxidase n=1 Tax=Heliocybe sulcata TaxID=5364 RepID=A0A5C3NKD3_9AGAM|nr:alcohol oxidase [Heliocybe sulcata]
MISSASVLSLLLSATLATAAIVEPATFASTSFDFIVAGGGTAGTAVAARLSEIGNWTVGLIEAGEYRPDDENILVPQGWNTAPTWGNPTYDWGFNTVPQPNLADRSINIVRGRVLGGSSALNLMGIFLAGATEYDQLEQLGNEGWNYNNTLKYFKKATNMSVAPEYLQIGEHATFNPQYHGNSGPIHASFSSWFSEAMPPLYNAMVNLGFTPVQDGGDGQDAGDVWSPPLSINQDTKTRSYSAIEYYGRNADRPNFHVLTGAQVTKIELSSTPDNNGNLRATGVTYVSGGQTYTASVSKDVVVSGGSIQSPHMLELSGIGNKTILESVGIESKIDLPAVGENYQDHLVNYEQFIVPHSIETWDVMFNPGVQNDTVWQEYLVNKTGPYTSSVNVISYQTASHVTQNDSLLLDWLAELDAQFNASNPSPGRRAMYNIERQRLLPSSQQASVEVYAAPFHAYANDFELNTSYIQISSVPSHPFSRGSIHVNSSDPLNYPRIDLNAWAFDIDRHMMTASAKYCRVIADTDPLKPIIQEYSFPGPNVTTDTEWEQFVAENVMTPFHPCCTNAMLPKDAGGVVDSHLTVYGTANVRVVDVSILPLQLGTHLMGTTYAIAEQAADIIKADYGAA